MKLKHLIIPALGLAALAGFAAQKTNKTPVQPVQTIVCNPAMWTHVYPGDPRRFKTPQDRLKVINPCVQITGTIVNAVPEKDGDWHIRLNLDPQFKNMLNAKNMAGQGGYLVLEPVCENQVSQKDTLEEHACDGFQGHVFSKTMIGKHVQVIGPFVTDMEHGWNEVHPVLSITVN